MKLNPKLLLVVITLIAGCSITPHPKFTAANSYCDLPMHSLAVDAGDGYPLTGPVLFESRLEEIYNAPKYFTAGQPISDSILVLSGGSQHGAFGAGVLSKWAEERPNGRLPRFKIVTGVSTGAIMATHAFIGETGPILNSFQINHERDVLRPYVKSADLNLASGLTVARRGALADLSPMRAQLAKAINPEILTKVASEFDAGRGLFVGMVDVDTGRAMIVDMTKLAKRFTQANAPEKTRIGDCYLNVIVASSSVPMAALPTFIDNRMYIDGGARFGLLSEEVSKFLDAQDARRLAIKADSGLVSKARAHVFVLINGDLSLAPKCGKRDPKICGITKPSDTPTQNIGSFEGEHEKWSILTLAGRSVAILIDQVYRFSNDRVLKRGEGSGFDVRVMRIGNGKDDFQTTLNHANSPEGITKSCRDWRQIDVEIDRPIEFHPRYMHCLIAYGRHLVSEAQWSELE